MFLDPNGAHTRPSAPMRNRERLMQVQMAHIRLQEPRTRPPGLRVHVGPVQIHLGSAGVDHLDRLFYTVFEDAEGARVGHHHAREFIWFRNSIGINFRISIGNIIRVIIGIIIGIIIRFTFV